MSSPLNRGEVLNIVAKKILDSVGGFVNDCYEEGYLENLIRAGNKITQAINDETLDISSKRKAMKDVLLHELVKQSLEKGKTLVKIKKLPPRDLTKITANKPTPEVGIPLLDDEGEEEDDDNDEEIRPLIPEELEQSRLNWERLRRESSERLRKRKAQPEPPIHHEDEVDEESARMNIESAFLKKLDEDDKEPDEDEP